MPALASSVPFEFRGRTIFRGSLSLIITHVDEERGSQEADVDFSASWFKLEEKRLWEIDWGKQRQVTSGALLTGHVTVWGLSVYLKRLAP